MISNDFCIGVDFGTDSVRSIIVDAHSGTELSSAVYVYPRWADGLYCDPAQNQFRQHPRDYIEGLEQTIKKCLLQAGPTVQSNIMAISVDTTGSTPVAVDESGTPLALLPAFENNPNAMFVLWKDHTAVAEALEINQHARTLRPDFTAYSGGIYSSEWFWSKLLHVLREDPQVRNACYTWVEHCDWVPFLLTGGRSADHLRRGVCAAGHKGLWAAEHGGFPPDSFFSSLDPLLKGYAAGMQKTLYTSDQAAGTLSEEWAQRLGLSARVVVGIGAIDAHMGAVGGEIEPYHLSKVIGTSTCDMLVAPGNEVGGTLVRGICGQVQGSIIPGMIGMEAGQSAFGDAYAWFKNLLTWPLQHLLAKAESLDAGQARMLMQTLSDQVLSELSRQAGQIVPDEQSEVAIDWLNGRRTPDANQLLKAAVSGLSLASDAPRIFRALVESTCFGARKISDRFVAEGIPVKGLIGVGGIAKKSPFVMQMLADVMGMPIRIHHSEQTCALGAAMFAATAAGIYPQVEEAMAAMGKGFDLEYKPDPQRQALYDQRFKKYEALCAFAETQTLEP
ncbi:ribulokinase [Pedobacter yulinensis]|uniref:Ribulokinase n=1 Tax=Pedobacter yulinensis TaxID=2126353 RepID=A0A2T3HKT6_9SPHI|nr:ribulokinase [Pedobacter yulinensis]PST83062.1 ribulokinase [Pedobacter yulinensis]